MATNATPESWVTCVGDPGDLPFLLKVNEVAELLRTNSTAVYARIARSQFPGALGLGRRILFKRDELLGWLDGSRVPSREVKR